MRHLLIGNGIIIQFGGEIYSNSNIINRAMKNAKAGRYEEDMKKTLSPNDAYAFFKLFRKELYKIIDGEYNKYAMFPTEINALADFKSRYPHSKININHIGFEDYFLGLRLIFNKLKENNETRTGAVTALKRFFLDAIYNNGEINHVYKKFPIGFKNFCYTFENIFTTNYDVNIENYSGQVVKHLHGQFNVLAPAYDINSPRNSISDKPAKNFNISENVKHLYCNAIMDFSKDFSFKMPSDANIALEKFTKAMIEKSEVKRDIESWANDKNRIIRNLYEGIQLKLNNPNIAFHDYYLSEFNSLAGELSILGLSPYNDTHLLQRAKENKDLHTIIYYYHDDRQAARIKNFFDNKEVIIQRVQDFWMSL